MSFIIISLEIKWGLNAAAFQLPDLPGSKLDSKLRTSWRVSMLKRPICPFVKDVTRWAGSLQTRSTEEGTPSSCAQKDKYIYVVNFSLKQMFRKKKVMDISLKSVLLSSLNTARAGEVVLASHSLTVPSPEQERRRWCALLYTKPQTESVCPHNSPRSIDGSAAENTRQHESVTESWFENPQIHKQNGGRRYRRSRRGRCWDWGCSSTV